MSEQDTMRLVAEVVDKFSGPLKELQKQMRETKRSLKEGHEEGAKAAREHAERIKELKERFEKTKDFVAEAVTPAMASVGIVMLGIGESIGTLAEKIKAAGESYNFFNDTVRRGHVSANYVAGLGSAFERLGLSADKANAFIASTGETLDKLKRGNAQEMARLQGQFSDTLPWLRQLLKGAESYGEASIRVMKALTDEEIPIDKRRKMAEAFGLDPRIASKEGKEVREAFEKSMRESEEHPVNMDLLQKLDDAYTELRISQRNFWNDLVREFAPSAVTIIEHLTGAMETLDDAIEKVKKAWEWAPFEWMKKSPGELFDELRKNSPPMHGDVDEFGRLIPDSFDSPDRKKETKEAVQEGTKQGLEEFYNSLKAQQAAGSFQPMAYHPDGGGGTISGGRGWGGGGYSLRPDGDGGDNGTQGMPARGSDKPGILDQGDAGAAGGPDPGAGLRGSAYLKAHRRNYQDAMKADPRLRKEIAGMMTLEGEQDPVPVVESLFNRAEYTGKSLRELLHSGFYGPINRGQLPGAIAALEHNPKRMARMNAAIEAALNGSNLIKGATDQGMASDPNGRWPGGRVVRQQVFNDWGGGKSRIWGSGHDGARRFREAQQAGVNAAAASGIRNAAALHGEALRRHFGHPSRKSGFDGSLLRLGRSSGLIGPSQHTVTGDASVKIDLHGFPRGTRAAASASGLFKEVRLNRGRAMPMASQDS
jgi:hypothetical protein